ncbi:Transposase DDE domain-containing protein [Devosia psychrophila]|uniref:Transposase DDE domain-containing protein n=1 Tax=Devosia psychrophila TaxID=728005 RepID=A0A1I1QNZ5_9HYPH|nr:Transposase DDE domain-containing protein [Devosia psychrophila]
MSKRASRYLAELEETDRAENGPATPRIEHPTERLASLRGRLGELEEIGRQLQAAPDEQISLTDPDARAMATGSDHRGVVGYNVQAAVDTEHHIVVANAVTNRGHDRSHLLEMAKAAQAETVDAEMIALADRGYYEGEQIRSCDEAGIIAMVPEPNISPAQARGFWGKTMFVHEPGTDTYRCPLGQQLQKRFARAEGGKLIGVCFNHKACGAAHPVLCVWPAKRSASDDGSTKRCLMPWSVGSRRCLKRWRFAAVLSSTSSAPRLDGRHPLPNTRDKERRHRNQPDDPAYNLKRAIAVAGVAATLKAITG